MDYGKSIPRADLLIKKKELERVIDDATKRLGSIDEVLKMFPPEDTAPQTFQPPLQKKLTNYERAEDVLKGRQVPMRLKDLYAAYLENGGQTKRASFDVSLGKWLKHPKKKIVRIDKGIYQYRS